MTDPKVMPMARDEFIAMLGEGFHTAFRKALDTPPAHDLWTRIRKLPNDQWDAVLEYVTWGFEQTYGLEWAEGKVPWPPA